MLSNNQTSAGASASASAVAGWTPSRREDIVCHRFERQALLYDPITDDVHVLNSTALIVWDLCDGQHDVADIVSALHTRFAGTTGRDVSVDVRATLHLLEAKGLINLPCRRRRP